MIGSSDGTADTPRVHITNMAAMGPRRLIISFQPHTPANQIYRGPP